MKEIDYATAVARVRINENNLLSQADIDRLINAKSIDEAVSLLNDKGYSKAGEPVSALFDNQMENAWNLIREIAPDFSEFYFMLVKNDFHNLKAALKGIVSEKDYRDLCLHPSVVEVKELAAAVRDQNFSVLPVYMRDVAKHAYESFVQTADGQLSDMIIDKGAMAAIILLSKDNSSAFIRDMGELMVAVYDMRVAVRGAKIGKSAKILEQAICPCKGFYSSELIAAAASGVDAVADYISNTKYGDAAEQLRKSIADFEKWCDNALTKYIEAARYSSFGPAPLASYIVKKEAELKTARIIVSGKLAGLDESAIKQRVRQVY